MATLVPIEHDPFAPAAGLTPVEGDPFAPPVDNSWTGMGKEALRSAGEGIAGLPDLLLGPGKDIVTLTKDIINPGKGPLPLGATPTRDLYNQNLPVTPGYENSWTREVGNIVGPTALTLGAGGVPAIVRGVGASGLKGGLAAGGKVVGDTALTSAGTIVGKEGGGALGGAIGGDFGRQVGGDIGSLLGGSLTTPAAVNTADYFGRKAFIDPQSLARFQEAQRSGMSPDLSLVGSDNATAWGSRGRAGAENRATQQEQIDAAIKAAADARSGRGQGPTQPIAASDIGQQVQESAAGASKNVKAAQDAALDPIYAQAGRDLPVDQTAEMAQLDALRRGAQPMLRAPVENVIAQTDAARFDPLNAPKVVDPGLEANLQIQLNQAQRRLQGANSPANAQAAQADVDALNQQIAANRGSTFQEVVQQRSDVGQKVDGLPRMKKGQQLAIKNAKTETLANAAKLAGVPRSDFQAANDEYARLADQRNRLDKTSAVSDPELAANRLNRSKTLSALQEHADQNSLANLMANNFELKARGPAVAGRPTLPRDVGLNPRGPDWWAGLSEDARNAYAGNPAIRQQIDDAMNLVRSDARRGGGQVETPDPTVPLAAGAAVLGHPIAAATAVLPKLGSAVFGGMMRSPAYAERLVNPTQLDPASGIARILAAAVAARR